MVAIIDINKTVEYILKRERDKDNPTVFVLGVLSSTEMSMIDDFAMSYGKSSFNPVEKVAMTLNMNIAKVEYAKRGLKGVKNLVDSEGKAVEFDKKIVDQLPVDVVYEIGEEIERLNKFSEEEEKN